MTATLDLLFSTTLYRAKLGGARPKAFLDDLRVACRSLQQEDAEGQRWADAAGYKGYTSYASIADLPEREPTIAALVERLDPHLLVFAHACDFELRGLRPVIDSIWVNILEPGGCHTGHIHQNSVISGTVYVDVPDGASALRLEDPRLGLMMAAPPRVSKPKPHNRGFVSVQPAPGTVLLWESWLRHEVPTNQANEDRISISFNAVLGAP